MEYVVAMTKGEKHPVKVEEVVLNREGEEIFKNTKYIFNGMNLTFIVL